MSMAAAGTSKAATEDDAHEAAPQKPALSNKQRQRQKQMRKQLGVSETADERTTCMMCGSAFESRTKLFTHLKSCRGPVKGLKEGRRR